MPNIRLLADNLIDRATLTASNTAAGTAINNVKTNKKGQIWQSTTTTPQITATFAANEAVNCLVLPICNLSVNATVRLRCYSDAGGTTLISGADSGTVSAVAATSVWDINANWITAPLGVNGFAYGSGRYAILYLNNLYSNVRHIKVDISDAGNPQAAVQLSRIVCGAYYEFEVNPDWGAEVTPLTTSTNTRNDAGDIITDIGIISRKLKLDFSYISDTEKKAFLLTLKKLGLNLPFFIDVYPNDADKVKQHLHAIYGKLNQLSAMKLQTFDLNASGLEVEEF